jgi:hypothetical protein
MMDPGAGKRDKARRLSERQAVILALLADRPGGQLPRVQLSRLVGVLTRRAGPPSRPGAWGRLPKGFRAAFSRTVSLIVAKGWIVLEPAGSSGRRLVFLTASGRRIFETRVSVRLCGFLKPRAACGAQEAGRERGTEESAIL